MHIITGGAGFIGFNLARSLLLDGKAVLAIDDLSRGRLETIAPLAAYKQFQFIEADCADSKHICDILAGSGTKPDHIWHLAANSDIPAGVADHRVDIARTFNTTVGVLEVAKTIGIECLHFASSSAIYGDAGEEPIHENFGPLEPISNYGAMKLASEALIRAAVESYLPRAEIYRFPNVIGVPATHGVIWDFVRKLATTPDKLLVLGNGEQQKSYLHVDDLIDAMVRIGQLPGRYLVYNIGPSDSGITVRSIAEAVRDRAAPGAVIEYGEGNRGWVGDVPKFKYSIAKLSETGWRPALGSEAAVLRAVSEIIDQEIDG